MEVTTIGLDLAENIFQVHGIARAKAAGKYKGRKPTARAKSKEVMGLHAAGTGASEIARQVGIGRASVYRILNGEQTGGA